MSPYELFRLAVWAFGVPIIVLLVIRAVRKVRDIRSLHQQLLDEEAAAAKNPYAEMARLHEAQQLLERARRGR